MERITNLSVRLVQQYLPSAFVLAFTWGDGWTNQIQPFWALPLLGVAGLSARDIMGYLLIWLLISGAAIAGTFVILATISQSL